MSRYLRVSTSDHGTPPLSTPRSPQISSSVQICIFPLFHLQSVLPPMSECQTYGDYTCRLQTRVMRGASYVMVVMKTFIIILTPGPWPWGPFETVPLDQNRGESCIHFSVTSQHHLSWLSWLLRSSRAPSLASQSRPAPGNYPPRTHNSFALSCPQ